MSRLIEIRARQDALRSAVLELQKLNEPAPEDEEALDDALSEFAALDEEAAPLQKEDDERKASRAQKLEAVIKAAASADNREETTGGLTTFGRGRHPNPYENVAAIGSGMVKRSEVICRALNAIEMSDRANEFGGNGHDRAEIATRKVEGSWGSIVNKEYSNDVAALILATGSPEYQDLFQKYMEKPLVYRGVMETSEISRTALSLGNTAGGFLLPYVLDPTIVLSNASSANPFRRISAGKTTTSNAWQGVNSAGVTAAWLAEGTAAADASPAVGQIQITPKKGSAWIYGSYEVLADTDFAQQLPVLLADARDRLEEAAFCTGNGTTQPKGVITAATQTQNTGTTLVFAVADVYKLQAALAPRFRNAPGAAWVMNVSYINKARQFDTAGGSSFWTNLGKGQPETLLGAPIYESTTMFGGTQAIGSKIAVFGDFGHFYIVDRVGVSLLYEPLVKDQATAFPTGQAGWFMFWRTGADLSTVNAMQVLVGL